MPGITGASALTAHFALSAPVALPAVVAGQKLADAVSAVEFVLRALAAPPAFVRLALWMAAAGHMTLASLTAPAPVTAVALSTVPAIAHTANAMAATKIIPTTFAASAAGVNPAFAMPAGLLALRVIGTPPAFQPVANTAATALGIPPTAFVTQASAALGTSRRAKKKVI